MIKNDSQQNKHYYFNKPTNIYQTFLPKPNALQL